MITVTGLTKRYGDRTAVDDLTFTVAGGRVTGFVGPNGAGKSTTMRMMVSLTQPDAGEVRYGGVRYRDLRNPARLVGTGTGCRHNPVVAPTRSPLAGHRQPGADRYVEAHLYDNVEDPFQLVNRVKDPDTTELRRHLAGRLAGAIGRIEGVVPQICSR